MFPMPGPPRNIGNSVPQKIGEMTPKNQSNDQNELATAILRQKASPNKLMVDDSSQDDNSLVFLSESTLERLSLFRSDTVLLKGKRRRETVAIVLVAENCEDGKIQMNKGFVFSLIFSRS